MDEYGKKKNIILIKYHVIFYLFINKFESEREGVGNELKYSAALYFS